MVNGCVWDKKPCPLNKIGQVRNGYLSNLCYVVVGIMNFSYPELAYFITSLGLLNKRRILSRTLV